MTQQDADTEKSIQTAFQLAKSVPGFLGDDELWFLGALAATIPARGTIVEIGSFKGKSTVMLGSIAGRYGSGRVVAIDPHAGLGYLGTETPHQDPTYDQFLSSLKEARVEEYVEIRRSFSREVAMGWNRPIRLLWIDGDHSYQGCMEDFNLFSPHLVEGAVVALHDTLNAFEGPIRVFVEQILQGGIRLDRADLSNRLHGVSIGHQTERATERKGENWKRVPHGLYLSYGTTDHRKDYERLLTS